MLTWQYYTDAKGEYRWRLKAANGEIIADSGEGYESTASRMEAVYLIIDSITRQRYSIEDSGVMGEADGDSSAEEYSLPPNDEPELHPDEEV